jgi:CheY-like chemotaxis protein
MNKIKSKDPSTRTILVVDDDRTAAAFFETLLYKDNFEVMIEHDGESALNLLKHDSNTETNQHTDNETTSHKYSGHTT